MVGQALERSKLATKVLNDWSLTGLTKGATICNIRHYVD